MSLPHRSGFGPAFGLLAVLLFAGPVVFVRASDDDDTKKEIAEVEKQIAELKKKLEALKDPPAPAKGPGIIPASAVKKMNWRCIGPANMSGRVTAIAVNETDPTTYYVATATGGLLKTTNNGTTFQHLFDHETTVSIGDVALAPSDPNIVWVGTGENNPRNSVSYGDGVYKSTNGGKTWQNMGLKQSFQIGRIIVHPRDPNIVYVGALGRLYGPNDERGVFKTEDGGKTWKKALFVDDKTGAIELRMDPHDPNTLLVGMWERKRDGFDGYFGPSSEWPCTDQYGPAVTYGPGGGLFRTTDAGKTWKKLTDAKLENGLPTVKTGRIGINYSRKTKGLVYAIIDTENVGKGRPVITVYLGITYDSEETKVVKVESVIDDGSAIKAGVKDGDILVAADGQKLANRDDVQDVLATKKPGDVLKLTVKRGDKELMLDVKLLPKAAPDTTPKKMLLPGFVPTTNQEGPVKVAALAKSGTAEKAGVKTGMEVISVDGKDVPNFKAFLTELRTEPKAENARRAGDTVKIGFKEGERPLTATLALEVLDVVPSEAAPATPGRPFLMDPTVGGQRENATKDQGTNGFQTGGVYASKDGGETWERVNSLNPRPFYFSGVRVDPTDDKTIYVLGDTRLWRSTNGGAKFQSSSADGVHPDHHALWIDPRDSRHMLLGCDGGFYATYDKGASWDHLNVLALGQFYHVCVDNRKPYNVYGGLQDNGSWGGPSHTLRGVGPVNDDWLFLHGGDGFVCRVDPTDPDIVYTEHQNGAMTRQNLRTGENAFLPHPKASQPLRWNWNTPFILSSHNPSIFYCGCQFVCRSIARGDNLKVISPELTRTKGGTVTAIAESPRNPDVLWAGTDDGNLWLTRDGGGKWDNLLDRLKAAGLPGPAWVSAIEPGRTVDGRCYVCIDAHRSNDDKPYLFVTEDFGQSWKSLTGTLPAFGSTRVLREDYTNPNLLYCGTEFGIWVSVNRGVAWTRVNNNLPTVAVHEVAQPTTASEIVVATHGRSLWVLDVASLRQMSIRTEKIDDREKTIDPLTSPVTFFTPAAVVRWKLETGREFPYSKDVRKFYGTNPAHGANFEYMLTRPAAKASLKVTDVNGTVVREFDPAPAEEGFHRQTWNLSGRNGIVPAGGYKVTLTVDGKEYSQALLVENDPKADPKAVITFDHKVPGTEEDDLDIFPFIPKLRR